MASFNETLHQCRSARVALDALHRQLIKLQERDDARTQAELDRMRVDKADPPEEEPVKRNTLLGITCPACRRSNYLSIEWLATDPCGALGCAHCHLHQLAWIAP